ncbi:MAG: hypothetical protein WDN04_13865 [Rhodospirillales bacterium]
MQDAVKRGVIWAAKKPARVIFPKASHVLHRLDQAASASIKTPPAGASVLTRIFSHAKRGSIRALPPVVLTYLAAHAIDGALKGGVFDTEKYGADIDALSYRRIQKAVANDDLAKVAGEISVGLRGTEIDEDELGKAVAALAPKLYGAAWHALGPAIAAIGTGAAAGAAAHVATGRGGNPYRDEDGRFTSRANAVVGAAGVAALTGALGAFAAVRHHNIGVFNAALERHLDSYSRVRSALLNPDKLGMAYEARSRALAPAALDALHATTLGRLGMLARAIHTGELPAHLEKKLDSDKGLIALKAELQRFGANYPPHYKAKIAEDVSSHLAQYYAGVPGFKVLQGKKWLPVESLGPPMPPSGRGDSRLYTRLVQAFSTMTPEQFEHGAAGLTDAQKDAGRKFLSQRQAWIDGVDEQLADHRAKLADLHDKVGAAAKAIEEAEATAAAATEPEAQTAAAAALKAAKGEHDRLATSHARLAGRAAVISPVTGLKIPPFDPDQAFTDARDELGNKQLAKLGDEFRDLREAELSNIGHRHARLVAAYAHVAPGAMGRDRPDLVREFNRSKKLFEDATGELADAEKTHAEAVKKADGSEEDRLKAVTMAQKKVNEAKKRLADATKNLTGQTRLVRQQVSQALRHYDEKNAQLSDARTAHAGAVETMKRVKQAQKGETIKGLSEVETQALRDGADGHGNALKAAADKLSQARLEQGTARQELAEAVARFESGRRAPGAPRRQPAMLTNRIVRDLQRAGGKTGTAFGKFVGYPTKKHFLDFTKWAATHVKQSSALLGRSVQHSVSGAFEHAVMRGDGDKARIDPWKLAGLTLGPASLAVAADAGRDLYHYGRDKALGTKDVRAKARLTKVKLEQKIDPFTGAGYHALTVAHPERKDERVVLFGEHFRDQHGKTEPIFAGASLSDVREQLARRVQQGGALPGQVGAGTGRIDIGADKFKTPQDKVDIEKAIAELQGNKKLSHLPGGLTFRADEDSSAASQADRFRNMIRARFLTNGAPKGRGYFDALASTVHSHLGRVLTQNQAYQLLTGYKIGGAKVSDQAHQIFTANPDFGSPEKTEVLAALKSEVARALATHEIRDELQRTVLDRAALTVAHAKGLDQDKVSEVLKQIRERPLAGAAPRATGTPEASRPQKIDLSADMSSPSSWHEQTFDRQARELASSLGTKTFGWSSPTHITGLAHGLKAAAILADKMSGAGLTSDQALAHVKQAITKAYGNGDVGQRAMLRDVFEDPERTVHGLAQLLQDEVNKAVGHEMHPGLIQFVDGLREAIDDWNAERDPLAKSLLDELRLPEGGPGGGEWTAGGGDPTGGQGLSGGQVALKEGLEGTAEAAGRKVSGPAAAAKPAQATPWYAPTRLAPELGTYLLGDVAGFAAKEALGPAGKIGSFALDSVAPNLFGNAGGALAATAVRRTVKGAAIGAAGLAGGLAGGAAAGAAVKGGYALAGKRAPIAAAPEETPAEQGGNLVGNIAGGVIGTKLAGGAVGDVAGRAIGTLLGGVDLGPAGAIVGGSLGAWAGGHIAEGAVDLVGAVSRYFGGYDAGASQKALARYTAPAKRAA